MTISVGVTATGYNGSGGSTTAASSPAISGSTFFVYVIGFTAGSPVITDNKSNSWTGTQIGTTSLDGSGHYVSRFALPNATGGSGYQVTGTNGATGTRTVFIEILGSANTGVDQASTPVTSTFANSLTSNNVTITPSVNGELLISTYNFWYYATTGVLTQPTGYTVFQSFVNTETQIGFGVAAIVETSSGTYNATWSNSVGSAAETVTLDSFQGATGATFPAAIEDGWDFSEEYEDELIIIDDVIVENYLTQEDFSWFWNDDVYEEPIIPDDYFGQFPGLPVAPLVEDAWNWGEPDYGEDDPPTDDGYNVQAANLVLLPRLGPETDWDFDADNVPDEWEYYLQDNFAAFAAPPVVAFPIGPHRSAWTADANVQVTADSYYFSCDGADLINDGSVQIQGGAIAVSYERGQPFGYQAVMPTPLPVLYPPLPGPPSPVAPPSPPPIITIYNWLTDLGANWTTDTGAIWTTQ